MIIKKRSSSGNCSLNINEINNFQIVLHCFEVKIRDILLFIQRTDDDKPSVEEIKHIMDVFRKQSEDFASCVLKDIDINDHSYEAAKDVIIQYPSGYWLDKNNIRFNMPISMGRTSINRRNDFSNDIKQELISYWQYNSFTVGFNIILDYLSL